MLVLGALSDLQYAKLRHAAGPRFEFIRARSWDGVLGLIRTRPVELAVLDPLLSGEPTSHEIERLRVLFPSLPLILYTSLTPALAAVLLTLGRRGISQVIFARFDDHPERLRDALEAEFAGASSQRFLAELASRMEPLRTEVRWAIEEALKSPESLPTVQRLAERAGVDRRTYERWFSRAGLPAPRHFLAAARVLYAHRLLQDPGFTIEDVARRLGYSRPRTLQDQARAYLGISAGEMRLSLTPEQALRRVVTRFFPAPRATRVAEAAG